MLRKIFLTLLFFISVLPAFAQECNPPYEMVTRLHQPDPGAYTVWDARYGAPEYDEAFASAVPLAGGSILAVGERRAIDGQFLNMVFVTFDRLGRQIEEKSFSLPGASQIVKMMRNGDDGYVVLVNIENKGRKQVWFGFFDSEKRLISKKTFSDEREDFYATDIVPAREKGWVISVSSRRNHGEGKARRYTENGLVFLLDGRGERIQERSYSPGGDNRISGLSVLKSKGEIFGYIATGYFVNGAGKKIAWVLRLDPNLSLNWQREYGRGLLAKFNVSESYLGDYILVFGDVKPVNGNPNGTWLALLNAADGHVFWQRYFYGESGLHDHSARGLFVNEDHRIVLMMMARSTQARGDIEVKEGGGITDEMDYAHLLTLSPRGIILGGDTFFYGQGADIQQLIPGLDGARLMAGSVLERVEDVVDMDGKADYVNPPLREEGRVFLPDVELSSKAKKGLELLQKKISEQEAGRALELAKRDTDLMRKGLLVVGDRLDTYNDPCSN